MPLGLIVVNGVNSTNGTVVPRSDFRFRPGSSKTANIFCVIGR